MKQARAAVLTRYNEPLEFRSFPLPDRPGAGEAIVRVEMAGICGTDVHLWKGELPVPLPVILGHESVGVVEAMGEGLTKDWRGQPLAVGDRVTWASSLVCGECFSCRVKRQPTRCVARKAYGISYCCDEAPHLRGGYAEQILLRAGSSIFRLPETLVIANIAKACCIFQAFVFAIENGGVNCASDHKLERRLSDLLHGGNDERKIFVRCRTTDRQNKRLVAD